MQHEATQATPATMPNTVHLVHSSQGGYWGRKTACGLKVADGLQYTSQHDWAAVTCSVCQDRFEDA